MTEKKGFFNFLKGWSSISEEEKQQKEYALSKENAPQKKPGKTGNIQQTRPEYEVTPEIETFCTEKLEEMLNLSHFSGKVKIKKSSGNRLHLELFDTGDDVGRIIGKSGQTLEAFQILIRNFVIRKFSIPIRLQIDAGDYRDKRHSQLKSRALKAAESVIHYGKRVELDPMNAAERRSIHLLFENDTNVKSLSEGEGNRRRIILVRRHETTSPA